MKPVLIDRSLVDINFCGDVDEKETFAYVASIAEAGASYVELGLDSLLKVPRPLGSEKYIYRLSAPEEFEIANAFNFAYALVPLRLSYITHKLNLPIILEIDIDGSDIFEVLPVIASNLDFSRLNMLRLTGEFDPETIPQNIANYRRRMTLPIDICPKNNSLTALSSAIAAYRASADAVTLSFGDDENYAALEEFLIMAAAVFGIMVSRDYLTGICKATLIASLIAHMKNTNLAMMMKRYMYCPFNIENADGVPKQKRRIMLKSAESEMPAAARAVSALGLERELSNEIIGVLKGCNMELGKRGYKSFEELQ